MALDITPDVNGIGNGSPFRLIAMFPLTGGGAKVTFNRIDE